MTLPRLSLFTAAFAILAIGSAEAETSGGGRQLNFAHDIVPILTKMHCNAGACHAKADVGQRGFRLSLLGFEPQDDYEHIVKEAKGRRVFPNAPEQSLLLLKAANQVPHGGGVRLAPGSKHYQTIREWIG